MKKTFKKLFAALLAAALVLAMAGPAFAETNAPKGSITIDGTVSGETYTIYRMFKLDSYNGDAYSYTVEDNWKTFFSTGAGSSYIDLDSNGHPTWKAEKSQDSDKAEFAKLALKWATENKVSAAAESQTSTGSDVIFPNLDLGYYLVDSSLGALCGLNTTKPNVTITEKNGQPTIEKKVKNHNNDWVDENTAKIGDTVEFKITIHVEAGAKNYVVTDTMDAGLSFSSGSIQVDGVALNDTIATLTLKQKEGDPTFTLTFDDSYVAGKVDETIVVTYTATLNENAVVAGNKNSATLHYGNKQTVKSETTTYTYEFDLLKVDGSDKKLLDGAEFKLYDAKNDGSVIKVVPVAGGYRVSNGNEAGATETIAVTGGKVHISGLDKTTYWLEETKAPEGYNMLTERKPVDLTNGSNNTTLTSDTWSETDHGVAVENNAGAILPGTGGMGTTLFYVIGGGLMVAAVVLLVTKKRMEHKN